MTKIKKDKSASENEKESLLQETKFEDENTQYGYKKGYVDCKPDCPCGGACNKCIIDIPQCDPECGCKGQPCKCTANVKSRANRVCKGTANILAGWPFHLIYITFCVIAVSALLIIVTIIIFTVVLHYSKRIQPHPVNGTTSAIPPSSSSSSASAYSLGRRSSLCKEITPDNSSLFIMGYLDAQTDKCRQFLRPTKNVFYVILKPLRAEEACNIESLLLLLTDKLVYVIEFDDNAIGKFDYIKYLQKSYVNLNRIRVNQTHFFQGSVFETHWNKSSDPQKKLAALVLLVWQFGGMAISERMAMNSREIIDNTKEICFADKDVIYCPQDCSAYTFELMKVIVNDMKSQKSVNRCDVEHLIDSSVNDFCSGEVAKIGCNRVYRLQKSDTCEDDSGACQFIRGRYLRTFPNYRSLQTKFCPHVSVIKV